MYDVDFRMSQDEASCVDLRASSGKDSNMICASIFNMHLGYKTFVRIGCALLDKNESQATSEHSDSPDVDINLKLKVNDVRCSYVHEHENYDNVPASYWDYVMAHPRVLSMYIDDFNLVFPISQGLRTSPAFCLSLRSFVAECGMIGPFGRPTLPIFCLKGFKSTTSSISDHCFVFHAEEVKLASHPSQISLLIGVSKILEQQLLVIRAQHAAQRPDLREVTSATRNASMPFKIRISFDMFYVSMLGAMGTSAALSGECKQLTLQAAPNHGCISWLHLKLYLSLPIGDPNDLMNDNYTLGKSESDSEVCRSALSASGNSRNIETQDDSFLTPHHRNNGSNRSLHTATTLTTNSFVSRYYSMESEVGDTDLKNGMLLTVLSLEEANQYRYILLQASRLLNLGI
jgi:hypothetical protein